MIREVVWRANRTSVSRNGRQGLCVRIGMPYFGGEEKFVWVHCSRCPPEKIIVGQRYDVLLLEGTGIAKVFRPIDY